MAMALLVDKQRWILPTATFLLLLRSGGSFVFAECFPKTRIRLIRLDSNYAVSFSVRWLWARMRGCTVHANSSLRNVISARDKGTSVAYAANYLNKISSTKAPHQYVPQRKASHNPLIKLMKIYGQCGVCLIWKGQSQDHTESSWQSDTNGNGHRCHSDSNTRQCIMTSICPMFSNMQVR